MFVVTFKEPKAWYALALFVVATLLLVVRLTHTPPFRRFVSVTKKGRTS
jgi:hypothetical protein